MRVHKAILGLTVYKFATNLFKNCFIAKELHINPWYKHVCQQPDQSFIFQQALIAKHIFCLHAHLQSCTWSRDKCFGSDLQDSRYLVQAFLTMSWMRMITIFDILVVIRVRPGRPQALSEPEPPRPFGIPLPEPTSSLQTFNCSIHL